MRPTRGGENSNLRPDPNGANIAELPRPDLNVQVTLAEIATLEQMDPPAYFVDRAQLDPAAWARLNAIKNVSMVQGNALGEALTGGMMPSKYYISDWNYKVTQQQLLPLYSALTVAVLTWLCYAVSTIS